MATREKNVLMIKKEKNDLIIEYPATKKECIVDFPANLPADGGNADTVDGKHAADLQNYNNLTNKPSTFLPASHTHTKAQITDFPDTYTKTEVDAKDKVLKDAITNLEFRWSDSKDFNEIYETGYYMFAGTVCANAPQYDGSQSDGIYGYLLVGGHNESFFFQIFVAGGDKSMFFRTCMNSGFSAWKKLYGDYETITGGLYMNTAVGTNALKSNPDSFSNTAFGYDSLRRNTAGYNTAIGANTLPANTTGQRNTSVGSFALNENTTGDENVAVGNDTLQHNTYGNYNSAFGANALRDNTKGDDNTAVGNGALFCNTTGNYNSAFGEGALFHSTTGSYNTAVGKGALDYNSGSTNTAVGYNALSSTAAYNNVTGLGSASRVTGSNQVQLGDTTVTVYAQKAISVRSDARDKLDIKDSLLGLDFIMKLKPREYILNPRERYQEMEEIAVINEETGEEEIQEVPKPIDYSKTNDGSKAGHRYHHGLVAQEVKEALDNLGVDFAGYQDHKITGGEDVLTLSYEEFIGPMIKAMQEMQSEIMDLNQQIRKLGA